MNKDSKRDLRQEKLARLFYEMGMDIELVSKISGVKKEKVNKFKNKNILNGKCGLTE